MAVRIGMKGGNAVKISSVLLVESPFSAFLFLDLTHINTNTMIHLIHLYAQSHDRPLIDQI